MAFFSNFLAASHVNTEAFENFQKFIFHEWLNQPPREAANFSRLGENMLYFIYQTPSK